MDGIRRPIGFSTGALAGGDVARGLTLQREKAGTTAVEVSALREHELAPLLAALPRLSLSDFAYVSVHAPSALRELDEETVLRLIASFPAGWPVIVHPELLVTPERWRSLGPRLCIENMDDRKATGRTLEELRPLFRAFPEASFCLDVGHARQIDPTMEVAIRMLRELGPRLRQVHVSEVGSRGEHLPLSPPARAAIGSLARAVPETCPLIIESVVPGDGAERELAAVATAFGGG